MMVGQGREEYDVISIKSVLVEAVAKTLAQMGLTIEPNLRRVSFQNAGSVTVYYQMDSDPVAANPTSGTPAAAQLKSGYNVGIPCTSSSVTGLRFIAADQGTCVMNVLQHGD